MPVVEYTIRRKVLTIFGAKFHIYNPEGGLIGFSQQKAFKLKEDIRVFTDETAQTERLAIKARQIVDFSAAYDVFDSQKGEKIGEVIEIISYPTVDAMLVKTGEPEGNWEIPLSDAYIEKVDTDAHVVAVGGGALADLERIPLKKKKVKPPRGPAQAAAGASEAADGSDETSEDEG